MLCFDPRRTDRRDLAFHITPDLRPTHVPMPMRRNRNRRRVWRPPDLIGWQILMWADAFHARYGRWPGQRIWREVIPGFPREDLVECRPGPENRLGGLPGGSSLAQL